MHWKIEGRRAGGMRTPLAFKFFRFHAVFRKIWQNRMLVPPRELAPPWGNPGSATAIYCLHFSPKRLLDLEQYLNTSCYHKKITCKTTQRVVISTPLRTFSKRYRRSFALKHKSHIISFASITKKFTSINAV